MKSVSSHEVYGFVVGGSHQIRRFGFIGIDAYSRVVTSFPPDSCLRGRGGGTATKTARR
ncbi:MAG: hypothetical protein OEX19_13640 [Gammaproteobacteria bacterium]|nr:hypothetical protein [Gammaproteobacteria bacterium]